MIRPAADQGLCVPALPGPCSHHGAQDREAANSLDGFHAAPSQRHFRSFKFLDRQVLFTGIPAVPAAGNRRRVNLRKKTRKRARPCGASSGFSCLCSSRVSCFRRAALGARLYSFEPKMGAINFLPPKSLPQVPHTSGLAQGELLHRNGLCIRKLFIPARLPAAVRSKGK